MVKRGTWVQKILTDVYSHQEHGTLHSYDFFENESGEWVYNVSFHTLRGCERCFCHLQIKSPVFMPVEDVIEKARGLFAQTKFAPQPLWNS